ncbi:MAG: hypothetical protein MZV64_33355 [Ignavibacteriales bacterium]|nr:hypothetical protein [Ignavibacteriales bacterium]
MNHAIKKKSIVFLISDFMDEGYEKILRIVGKKHDLIGIVINDQREKSIPKMGLVKFTDAETGKERWIDTSSRKVQNWIMQYYAKLISDRKSLFIKSRLDSIEIKTGENYVTPLVNFFRLRERRW